MKVDTEFRDFNKAVRLDQPKRDNLKIHRKALRKRIREYFDEKGWQRPSFSSQGSFPLRTNVNPIWIKDADENWIQEYDLDDGVYFICPEADREYAKTYYDRVLEAVDGHTKACESKPSCVRVIYYDGHHVDMPIYWAAEDGSTPQIARANQGYTDSDPKQFKEWVEKRVADTTNVGQLRRIIRYLKAWKNYQENQNPTLRLPPGVTLTILAANNLIEDENDDVSFRESMRRIRDELESNFVCSRPTTPTNDDLLVGFPRDRVIRAFSNAIELADEADKHTSKSGACGAWRKVFGDRFPEGKDEKVSTGTKQLESANDQKRDSLYNAKKLLESRTARTGTTGVVGTIGVSNIPHKFYGDEEVHSD